MRKGERVREREREREISEKRRERGEDRESTLSTVSAVDESVYSAVNVT